ncbi:MAG: YigZ family protein [Saprospiraceae bacterium]|nr:YigZ family protein [Candidatus Vicinibacter affinis]MBP6172555.1 YigZ family protein [Saprospiraceae bacterium]MBK6825237.1 YigZ family protein [Candidatus Vicinibacter affinis]MBK7304029.1 YigZ family protein [Candidatus Vicinibacter affinis]MBK7798984.1 YigZ family protein [Candidatus Vicinibacter affinis]
MSNQMHSHLTLELPSEGNYSEKGSRFIAFAIPFKEVDLLKVQSKYFKTLHPKSRHVCAAVRTGTNGEFFRLDDDGEPSGTAAKPMLGQIDSFRLTDVGVFCVRYFGGIQLGTSGLIKAYKTAAFDALNKASIIEIKHMIRYRINAEPEKIQILLGICKQLGVVKCNWDPINFNQLNIEFPIEQKLEIIAKIKTRFDRTNLDKINDNFELRSCIITEV